MDNLGYLAAALTLVWVGAALYLFRLSALRRDLERRIKAVETRLATTRVEP